MRSISHQPSARELRRAKRKPLPVRPPIPMFVRMQYVLAPLETIISDIERTECVSAVGDTPVVVLPGETGILYPMAPAIDGIADFYEMFWARRGKSKDLSGIRQFAKRLQYGMPITALELDAVKADMAAMRAIVPMLTDAEATSLIQQTQIKGAMQEAGYV